ncbi:MAG: methylmalonyl Co-A mutase-associated GTPase MeaB [Gammaproteobacteria bacterium]|nr:methylmalonyl Co-A mutase-associated GTPase MeaB [Gammaproteobacteria bacterium]
MPSLSRRELGRRLSRLADASVAEVLAMAPEAAPAVPRIGLTGAPGVGKSSLAGRLGLLRAVDRRLGMLAVDPSSPLTGGAILGDRIRLDELAGAENLYLRSVASRSATDGLADNLPEMLETMAAAGFEELLLETVGVGQAEHAVRSQVDTLVLVLMPGSGDTVQAMKAGIMELADIYVVNKCDLAGANEMAAEIRRIQALVRDQRDWQPPVLLTSIRQPESIARLSATIDEHRAWLETSGTRAAVTRERARYRLRLLLERRVAEVTAACDARTLAGPLAPCFDAAIAALAGDRKT